MIRREKDGERNSAGEKKRKREKDGEKPTFPRDVIQIRASEILELPFPKPSWLKIEKEGVHPRRSVDNTELFTSLTSFEDSRVFSHIWTDNCWFLWYSMGCFFANLAQSLPLLPMGMGQLIFHAEISLLDALPVVSRISRLSHDAVVSLSSLNGFVSTNQVSVTSY